MIVRRMKQTGHTWRRDWTIPLTILDGVTRRESLDFLIDGWLLLFSKVIRSVSSFSKARHSFETHNQLRGRPPKTKMILFSAEIRTNS